MVVLVLLCSVYLWVLGFVYSDRVIVRGILWARGGMSWSCCGGVSCCGDVICHGRIGMVMFIFSLCGFVFL